MALTDIVFTASLGAKTTMGGEVGASKRVSANIRSSSSKSTLRRWKYLSGPPNAGGRILEAMRVP